MKQAAAFAIALGMLVFNVGCGNSTAPANPALVAHFDSLTTQAAAVGAPRYYGLLVATNALAHGAKPVHVMINVAGIPTMFQAIGTELGGLDTAYYPRLALFSAWSDPDALTMVYGIMYNDGGVRFEQTNVIYIQGDSYEFYELPYVGTHQDLFFHPNCADVPITNVADGLNPHCMLGQSRWSFDVVMGGPGSGDSLLPVGAVISMPANDIPTDLLSNSPQSGAMDRALRHP